MIKNSGTMPSIVWRRDPQEAYAEPYEYEAQEQFAREATTLLGQLYLALNSPEHQYTPEDRSSTKAMWLLAMDALDSLRDSLEALQREDHRVAGKLFRDVMESMDLATYFSEDHVPSQRALARWYGDEYVPHSEYRDRYRQLHGEPAAKALSDQYRRLSRFTHRSYSAVLDGYTLGGGSRLVHDRTAETFGHSKVSRLLVPPQTIAAYYAALSAFILDYAAELEALRLVDPARIRAAIGASLEIETVPRRFRPAASIRPPAGSREGS